MNVNAKFMSMFVLIMVSNVIFYFNFRMYHDKKKLWDLWSSCYWLCSMAERERLF